MSKTFLYFLNIFNKGWQISLLILLTLAQKELHISLIEIGFLSMTLSAVSITVSFFAGHINDRLGNKNVILISLFCYFLAWLGLFVVDSHWLLYAIYGLAGVSSGLFDPISSAIIARKAHDDHRGSEIGNFDSVGDLGRIALTTFTTLMVGFFALKSTALVFAILSLLLAIVYLAIHMRGVEVHVKDQNLGSIHPLHLFRSRSYLYAIATGILDSFSSASIFIFLPLLLAPKGISIANSGLLTALFFFGYLSGRLLLGRFSDRHGKVKVLIIGEICMAALIVALVFMSSYWLIIVNLFLLGVFTRGTAPIIKAMVADSLIKSDFEKGYGLLSATLKTSNALSRPSYAFAATYFGVQSMFYISGAVALLAIIPAVNFFRAKKS